MHGRAVTSLTLFVSRPQTKETCVPIRSAEAVWEGELQGGKGSMRFGSGAYDGQYSFTSRFEEGTGTNPEELIAAAHSG